MIDAPDVSAAFKQAAQQQEKVVEDIRSVQSSDHSQRLKDQLGAAFHAAAQKAGRLQAEAQAAQDKAFFDKKREDDKAVERAKEQERERLRLQQRNQSGFDR